MCPHGRRSFVNLTLENGKRDKLGGVSLVPLFDFKRNLWLARVLFFVTLRVNRAGEGDVDVDVVEHKLGLQRLCQT